MLQKQQRETIAQQQLEASRKEFLQRISEEQMLQARLSAQIREEKEAQRRRREAAEQQQHLECVAMQAEDLWWQQLRQQQLRGHTATTARSRLPSAINTKLQLPPQQPLPGGKRPSSAALLRASNSSGVQSARVSRPTDNAAVASTTATGSIRQRRHTYDTPNFSNHIQHCHNVAAASTPDTLFDITATSTKRRLPLLQQTNCFESHVLPTSTSQLFLQNDETNKVGTTAEDEEEERALLVLSSSDLTPNVVLTAVNIGTAEAVVNLDTTEEILPRTVLDDINFSSSSALNNDNATTDNTAVAATAGMMNKDHLNNSNNQNKNSASKMIFSDEMRAKRQPIVPLASNKKPAIPNYNSNNINNSRQVSIIASSGAGNINKAKLKKLEVRYKYISFNYTCYYFFILLLTVNFTFH